MVSCYYSEHVLLRRIASNIPFGTGGQSPIPFGIVFLPFHLPAAVFYFNNDIIRLIIGARSSVVRARGS